MKRRVYSLFILFVGLLFVLMLFTGCQMEADGVGTLDVQFSFSEGKGIVASTPSKAVSAVYVRFSPCFSLSRLYGATDSLSDIEKIVIDGTAYETGVVAWNTREGKGSTSSSSRFFTQGLWLVEAIALDEDGEVLYKGSSEVYISAVANTASICLAIDNASRSEAKGTILLGTEENPLWTNSLSASKENQQLRYTFYRMDGSVAKEGIVPCSGVEEKNNWEKAYFAPTSISLPQDEYVVAVTLEQKKGSAWIPGIGGSVTTLVLFQGDTITVTGDVRADNFIKGSIEKEKEVVTDVAVAITLANGKLRATATKSSDSTFSVNRYMWIIDGEVTVISSNLNTNDLSFNPAYYGEHVAQVVVLDSANRKSDIVSVTVVKRPGSNTIEIKD